MHPANTACHKTAVWRLVPSPCACSTPGLHIARGKAVRAMRPNGPPSADVFLGQLVPGHAPTDARTRSPAEALRGVVDRRADGREAGPDDAGPLLVEGTG